MRKIKIVFIIYLAVITIISCQSCKWERDTTADLQKTQIYFVDSEMMRLIPSDLYINNKSKTKAAKIMINELIKGKDDNPKIKRIIPNIDNCLSVNVKNDTAYVDISDDIVQSIPKNKLNEDLFVYQVVNSLTSIDGIVKVKFTICGESKKNLAGFIDMRETFIPEYY